MLLSTPYNHKFLGSLNFENFANDTSFAKIKSTNNKIEIILITRHAHYYFLLNVEMLQRMGHKLYRTLSHIPVLPLMLGSKRLIDAKVSKTTKSVARIAAASETRAITFVGVANCHD